MANSVLLDDALVRQAQEAGNHKTAEEAVTAALHEYIRRRRQLSVLELAGSINYAEDYDYKALRRSR